MALKPQTDVSIPIRNVGHIDFSVAAGAAPWAVWVNR